MGFAPYGGDPIINSFKYNKYNNFVIGSFMRILDGKAAAAEIRAELAREISAAVSAGRRPPGLAVILAGDDPASQIYVRNKQKACGEAGIISFPHILPGDVSQEALLELINELNLRDDVDGILLQLPLPRHLDAKKCLMAIDPKKDADAFHPLNMGKLALGLPAPSPCTPAGILELLKRNNLSLSGKKAVVLGRSDIVGKPLALLLARKGIDATVTICHSATPDLARECAGADFLFAAIGKAKAVGADLVPEGCVVVDVGVHRGPDGLCGDVDSQAVCGKVSAITPVPGGVGPMTIAMLLRNTVDAWRENTGLPAGRK